MHVLYSRNISSNAVGTAAHLFNKLDIDQSRCLSPEELQRGIGLSNAQRDSMLELYDNNKNGKICLDEFIGILDHPDGLVGNELLEWTDANAESAKKNLSKSDQCAARTTQWQEAVTGYNSAHLVSSIFSDDAVLLGTISRTIRTKDQEDVHGIKEYFDYFAKLPGIQVVERDDNIVAVSEDVFINNAMVYWAWEGAGAPTPENPLCARMTFVFRYNSDIADFELFELHSSALPAPKID